MCLFVLVHDPVREEEKDGLADVGRTPGRAEAVYVASLFS